MIRAICLNPLIDRSYFIADFAAGRQYKDNVPSECVGGKGINVAKVCHQLNEPVAIYGFIGGETGRRISAQMEATCDQVRFIDIPGENRMTINVIDRSRNLETEIVERGPRVDATHVDIFMNYLEQDLEPGDIAICSGITIDGAPTGIYTQISALCERAGALCFLDTNGETLFQSLGGKYFFGKPNHKELAELCNVHAEKDPYAICAMGRSIIKNRFRYLLVSLGADGGIFVSEDGCLRIIVPQTPVMSTIGSGDSTVAGFSVGIARGMDVQDAIKLAMACGVANSMTADVARIDTRGISGLIEKIELEKL